MRDGPRPIRLIVFDCDQTLWDHPDVSRLRLPFVAKGSDSVRDQDGVIVTLYPGVRNLLHELLRRGYILSIASWNDPEAAFQPLRLMGLWPLFRYPKADLQIEKADMIAETLRDLEADGIPLSPDQVVLLDDNSHHIEAVPTRLPGIHVLHMWHDPKRHDELLAWLDSRA